MSSEIVPAGDRIPANTLLQTARDRATRLVLAEETIARDLHQLCVRLWDLGESLAALRDLISHGQWNTYVEANFPELGVAGNDSRRKRASDARAFFEANPNVPNTGQFTAESIRKCVFHLAPEKEKPQLAGDQDIPPVTTHLTFVNNSLKFFRRVAAGLEPKPEVSTFRREVAPVLKEIIEIGGREWIAQLLAE